MLQMWRPDLANDTSHSRNEIIIVRRNRDDHDDHHGGVWKIAFADFMTAMMAFFLVMWLINASNEETKKAVASYFNPIKLMDRTSNPKGVRSPKYGASTKAEVEPENQTTLVTSQSSAPTEEAGAAAAFDEQALFSDPYSLLAEIAAGIDSQETGSDSILAKDKQNGVGIGLSGGAAFQDPFDPMAWNLNFGAGQGKEKAGNSASDESSGNSGQVQDSDSNRAKSEFPENEEEIKTKDNNDAAALSDKDKSDEKNRKIADKIRKDTLRVLSSSGAKIPNVEITSQDNGVLITLSDSSKIGMFNIGSARPTAELVRVMAGIGKILSSQNGQITIAGHTDGRKYTSGHYDNWRLSTARAHMAYYMLVNGGLQEERIDKIVGYAARKLAKPEQPYAAVNRRIELFLSLQ